MIHDGPSFDAQWLSRLKAQEKRVQELDRQLNRQPERTAAGMVVLQNAASRKVRALSEHIAAQTPELLAMIDRHLAELPPWYVRLWKRITGK